MKLQHKIALFMTGILVIVIGGIGILTFNQVEKTIEKQMGSSAMDLAQTIASMASIKNGLTDKNKTGAIQNIIEDIRAKTRFQYIIVLDMKGIKHSYPIKHGLGKKYVSGGEEAVLERGDSYISEDKNVLFSAFRAFVPIYNDGEQVGAVIVGLLTDKVYEEVRPHITIFRLTLLVGLIIGIIAAALLSVNIKRSIYGLEPKEIAVLLGQHQNVLQSLNNGIVAIDNKGHVLLFNKIAKEILNLNTDDIGRNISELEPSYTDQMMDVIQMKKPLYNEEVKIQSDKILLCSYTPFFDHRGEAIGVVNSFQDLTEVKSMAEELTGIKKMAYALRAQNHEFMNKLHTISGLIQLESYDEAVEYIEYISEEREEISEILNYKIRNPYISAILLAKYNKASEAKIVLDIDPASYLDEIPKSVSADEICSLLGNLIENAMDELVKYENGIIKVYLHGSNEGLEIRIQDNGPGIDPSVKENLFDRGVTTKEGNRGTGLSIVKKIVDCAGGKIEVKENKGVIWTIYIPA